MNSLIQARVRREVEELHAFFVGWFTGAVPQSAFESGFLARFSPDLVFIPPRGSLLGLAELSDLIRARYNTNPHFRIQIRRVQVHREIDGYVLATYEEWQRNALASQPPDNGRISTALFSAGDALRWCHIHETWLPEAIMAAGPYDF